MGIRGVISEAAKPFFDFEEEMDVFMEKYYKSKGCKVYKNGDTQKDITLSYNGIKTSIEHKYRKVIYNDVLVEIIQDVKSNNSGWLYGCGAEKLNYIICQPVEEIMQPIYFHKIEFESFRNWFFKWYKIEKHPEHRTCKDKGYGLTLNVVVPLNKIPEIIIEKRIIIKNDKDLHPV